MPTIQTTNWEIVGYQKLPMILPTEVNPILQKKDDPDFWFFEQDPKENIIDSLQEQIMTGPLEQTTIGFDVVIFDEPIPYKKFTKLVWMPINGNGNYADIPNVVERGEDYVLLQIQAYE